MNLRAYNRVRHIHNRDSLPPELVKSAEKVLEAAAGNLQSNIFLFLDVDSEVTLAPEYGKAYGVTRRILRNDPCFDPVDDAVMAALANGPFLAVIWIASLPLSQDVPEVFRTGILAHELGHARQIEDAEGLMDAWECYEAFLSDKQESLSRWACPLEIDAELFARKVIQQLHPDESLDQLLDFYKDYTPVLQFESSGGFDILQYFEKIIREGPPGFRQWVLVGPRDCRTDLILSRLAPE